MAVPSRRHKAGAREIRNRESKQSQEKHKKGEDKEEISREEHDRRGEELKKLGLIR